MWQQHRSNLPAGPDCQRPLDTESVSADFGHPIRTAIDGAGPSCPSRRGLDETLALATGNGKAKLTEGCRGWLGWLQGGGGLSEACSASKTCRRGCSRVVRGHARSRGPRAPSTMVAFSCYQRGNERQGEVQILRRKRTVQGESRERGSALTETFTVYPCSGDVPQAQRPGE
jgi:hypothetical protein